MGQGGVSARCHGTAPGFDRRPQGGRDEKSQTWRGLGCMFVDEGAFLVQMK